MDDYIYGVCEAESYKDTWAWKLRDIKHLKTFDSYEEACEFYRMIVKNLSFNDCNNWWLVWINPKDNTIVQWDGLQRVVHSGIVKM